MTSTVERYLIVNADDFGQSHGVNAGIALAHERGIVTSVSLMVRWEAVAQAASYAHAHPAMSAGLHVDLGEWAYRDGQWAAIYEVVPGDDRALVAAEVGRQLERFRELMGRDPSHLDSHQHVHKSEPSRSILEDLADQLAVPLRNSGEEVTYSGEFYGQWDGRPLGPAITPDRLIKVLASLNPGVTELGCHPGHGNDVDSMYGEERAVEVETLCDPKVRQALTDLQIRLCNFDTRPRVSPATARPHGAAAQPPGIV